MTVDRCLHRNVIVIRVLAILALLIGATLIRGAIYLIIGTTSFFTKSVNDFGAYTQELFDKTTMYPLTMYPEGVQLVLTYLIPIGWVSFYPISELVGVANGRFAWQGAVWVTLGVGVLTFLVAALFFRWGLTKYESAGN